MYAPQYVWDSVCASQFMRAIVIVSEMSLGRSHIVTVTVEKIAPFAKVSAFSLRKCLQSFVSTVGSADTSLSRVPLCPSLLDRFLVVQEY